MSNKNACPICQSTNRSLAYITRDLLYDKEAIYHYYNCHHCFACFIHPMPSDTEIASFYPDDYLVYEPVRAKKISPLKRSVLHYNYNYKHLNTNTWLNAWAPLMSLFLYKDSLTYIESGTVLDIGCGNGKFLLTMRDLGWNCQGVEFNSVAVQACQQNDLTVFEGELQQANLADHSIDLITVNHLIEHLPKPAEFLTEVKRILKPGGTLNIRTPNSQALGRRWFKTYWYANDVPRHLILYSPDNLNWLMKQLGFTTVQLKLFTSPKIILNSYDYTINNRLTPSNKKFLHRRLAKLYVTIATLMNAGDEIFATYYKLER